MTRRQDDRRPRHTPRELRERDDGTRERDRPDRRAKRHLEQAQPRNRAVLGEDAERLRRIERAGGNEHRPALVVGERLELVEGEPGVPGSVGLAHYHGSFGRTTVLTDTLEEAEPGRRQQRTEVEDVGIGLRSKGERHQQEEEAVQEPDARRRESGEPYRSRRNAVAP